MLFERSLLLFNTLNYCNINELLNVYVLNININNIISESKFINKIILLKKRYINAQLLTNNTLIVNYIRSNYNSCPHLYLLHNSDNSNKSTSIYTKKCILCDNKTTECKNAYHTNSENKWQHYIKNENIQHEIIIRSNVNQMPNIMNVFTINLNNYFNNPSNRYSYKRFLIIQKLSAIQLHIVTYSGIDYNLFLNKSWLQFLNRNKDNIIRTINNKRKIENISFENEILSYKLNRLKNNIKCCHKYKKYKNNIYYCSLCKSIKEISYCRQIKKSK